MKKVSFNKKVVWITGASSGIGAAMARQLNELGATVIASARRIEKLIDLKNKCQYPDRLLCIPLDITDPKSIIDATNIVMQLPKLDLLIHNAGIAQKGLVTENQMAIDRTIMETNYFGTVALTKAVMPLFQRQGHGWFAVMSSFAGVMGIPGRSAYAASKHALHGFFESLKAEKLKCKLKVSYIIPGFINTQITAKGLKGDGTNNGTVETSHRLGMTAERCASHSIRGLKKGKGRIAVGKFEVYLLRVNRLSPSAGHYIIKNHPMKRIRKAKYRLGRLFRFNIAPFIRTSGSLIAMLFALLMLLQSCSIYYKHPISKEQASYSKDPLKLKMNGKNYKIEALKYNDSATIAVAKENSKLAKRHPDLVISQSEKIVEVDLSEKGIESIRQKDVKNSRSTTILVSVASAALITLGILFPFFFVWAGIEMASWVMLI